MCRWDRPQSAGKKMFIDPEITASCLWPYVPMSLCPYDMADVLVPHANPNGVTSTKLLSMRTEREVYCMQIFMKLLRSLSTAR